MRLLFAVLSCHNGVYKKLEQGIRDTWGDTEDAGVIYLHCDPAGSACLAAYHVGDTLYADTEEGADNILRKMNSCWPLIWDVYGGQFDYLIRPCSGSYFVVDRLKDVLRDKPRNGLCFGIGGGDHNGVPFLSGAGYVLSADVVKRLATGRPPYHPTCFIDDVSMGYALTQMGYKLDSDGAMRTECGNGQRWSVDDGSYHYHFRKEWEKMYEVHEALGVAL